MLAKQGARGEIEIRIQALREQPTQAAWWLPHFLLEKQKTDKKDCCHLDLFSSLLIYRGAAEEKIHEDKDCQGWKRPKRHVFLSPFLHGGGGESRG